MTYNLASEKLDSIKEYFIKIVNRQLSFNEFIALNNITFNVSKGDVLGILGLNGSGKSTLLKIISGILKPSGGYCKVKGSISPLIELGAGFDPDLTGKENIFLNGSVLGYSEKFMKSVYNDIVEFSELQEFINIPVKNYSSGMYARLGFSIATITEPDILIVDEILSVGDFKFGQKCEEKIASLMKKGTTIIMVSHAIDQIERLCNKVVWLEKGCIKKIGNTSVCEEYKHQ